MSTPFNPGLNLTAKIETSQTDKMQIGRDTEIAKTCTGGGDPGKRCTHWLVAEEMCDGTVRGCGAKR